MNIVAFHCPEIYSPGLHHCSVCQTPILEGHWYIAKKQPPIITSADIVMLKHESSLYNILLTMTRNINSPRKSSKIVAQRSQPGPQVFSGLTNMLTGPIVNAAVDSNNFVPLLVEVDHFPQKHDFHGKTHDFHGKKHDVHGNKNMIFMGKKYDVHGKKHDFHGKKHDFHEKKTWFSWEPWVQHLESFSLTLYLHISRHMSFFEVSDLIRSYPDSFESWYNGKHRNNWEIETSIRIWCDEARRLSQQSQVGSSTDQPGFANIMGIYTLW